MLMLPDNELDLARSRMREREDAARRGALVRWRRRRRIAQVLSRLRASRSRRRRTAPRGAPATLRARMRV